MDGRINGTTRRITCGELLERGDRALHEVDTVTLGRIGQLLAGRMGDPITRRLHDFVKACAIADTDLAAEWARLRRAITDRIAIAGT